MVDTSIMNKCDFGWGDPKSFFTLLVLFAIDFDRKGKYSSPKCYYTIAVKDMKNRFLMLICS